MSTPTFLWQIGQVQNLPNKIRELRMDYIPDLTYIDHWPDSARYISAMHDYYWDGPSTLQPVPPLPPYLEYLDLYANLLDTLRDIPPTLRELKMDRNRLDYFPVLPNELRHLNIRGNLVPSIPSLPDSLRYLDVGGLNPFPSLPPFHLCWSSSTAPTSTPCRNSRPSHPHCRHQHHRHKHGLLSLRTALGHFVERIHRTGMHP
ncbi:MAG: hypothetical protein R2817_08700 [Flavobacteriales bacterium]